MVAVSPFGRVLTGVTSLSGRGKNGSERRQGRMESWISLWKPDTQGETWPVFLTCGRGEAPRVLNTPLQVRCCSLGSRGQTWGRCGLRAAEPQPHSVIPITASCSAGREGSRGPEQDLSPHL